MNEPTHDPIVTLRLELARVTDQRDAYEKSLRTEVLKLLEQVTVSVAVATDKEVSRLKAEVERLDDLCKKLMAQHSDISCDNIQLQARCDFLEGRNQQ